MNKQEIMRQSSMDILVEEMIKHQPGVTSAKLFDLCKEWAGKTWEQEDTFRFEAVLQGLVGKYRCTNKQWYPIGHVAEPKVKHAKESDPRQVRMDW